MISNHAAHNTRASVSQHAINNFDCPLKYYRHLRNLERYVDRNIASSFQLTDIADDIGVSSSRLSHLFVEKLGISYSAWLRQKRVQLASEQLANNDDSVLSIAISVGYSNTRSLERAFKKVTGLTPTQYRKSLLSHILEQ